MHSITILTWLPEFDSQSLQMVQLMSELSGVWVGYLAG
jgi:hypothetical protein